MLGGKNVFLIIVGLIIESIFITGALSSKAESQLIKDLFKNYEKKERPAKNDADTVNVEFLVYLRQIIDVEEKLQIIQTNLWLSLNWLDYRLRWNPAEYNNISRVIMPIELIWCPDILLYNSANEKFDPTFKVNVEIFFSGEIRWTPPGIFASTCPINIQYFPFDTQHCKLKFSSWTYDMARINLTLPSNEADAASYVPNGEWDLIDVPAVRNEQGYECCPEVYVDATYTIIITRRPLFYLFNLVLPTVLISVISLLAFTLPVESGEKVTLCVTTVLSICVFLILVMQQLPATSDAVPLLGIYFAGTITLLSLSVCTTIFVVNFFYRTPGTHTLPRWVRIWINGYLAFILRMKRPEVEGEEFDEEGLKRLPTLVTRSDTAVSSGAESGDSSEDKQDSANFVPADPAEEVRWRMRQISRELRTITKKMGKTDDETQICEEWKFASCVIDRLCFWLLSVMMIVLTLVLLFVAPRPSPAI